MNREIIFRGKNLDNGEWVFGYLFVYEVSGATMILDGWKSPVETYVDPSTVGQYTGLTDESDTRIFEGDVVRISIPIRGCKPIVDVSEVYFDKGCFCVNWGGSERDHFRTRIDSFAPGTTFEVIGNVHNNPDLLEGGGR